MIIGLTGNIGSGKSTVSRYLDYLGARVVNADHISRKIVEPGKPALKQIVETFGEEMLNQDGTLNREALGNKIFQDPGVRKKLDSIMHPLVNGEIQKRINQYKNIRGPKAPALVVEIPLLFETGTEHLFDEIWVVTVDKHVQVERIMHRDNISEEQALQRIASQMPQSEKIKKASRVIDNSGSREKTLQRVSELWNSICGNQ